MESPHHSSDSSSSGVAAAPTGQSSLHRTSRSTENPLRDTTCSPLQIVYEESSEENKSANQTICPQDYLEPAQLFSVRTERSVTNDSSVEVNNNLSPRSRRARVANQYSCGLGEIAILNISVLVILLSASTILMAVLLLLGVVSTNRPTAPIAPTVATTDPIVSPGVQEQIMVLRNGIELINSRINRITNQTVQDRLMFQSRFDGFQSQLVVFNQSIQSNNTSRPILFGKPNTSINTEQICVMDERVVCSLQQFACSGAQEPVVNSNSELSTEYSCYLRSNGLINGSAALVTSTLTQTTRSGAFTVPEVQNANFLQSCFCFLFSSNSEFVECVIRTLRCSSSVTNLPLNVVV